MSTATAVRYTPDDLLAIADRPMPELVGGELLEREPMGQKADAVGANIVTALKLYSRSHLRGVVNGANGSYRIFPDDPDKVRIADASFTRKDRLPDGEPAHGHGRVAPDLVVEVISPNGLAADLDARLDDYQSAGIPLIWVVNPDIRTVRPYLLVGPLPVLHVGDLLTGVDVLPGFECPVADLFEDA